MNISEHKKTPRRVKLLFIAVFVLALFFRLYGINWDSGFHLHPDERAIILAVMQIHLPSTIGTFFSSQSSLNPHFFAYGNFPMYLLALNGWVLGHLLPFLATYDGILYVGRGLSALFDLGTVCLLYFLGRKLHSQMAGILASFFYTISLLPIQLSHFYAVDTVLTFFTTLFLFLALRFYEHPTLKKVVSVGVVFGLAFATKISAVVLAAPFALALIVDDFLLGAKTIRRRTHLKAHLIRFFPTFLIFLAVFSAAAVVTVILTQPYILIDKTEFLAQTQQQSAMTKDAFVFPYTLQYVGIVHYVYELRNLIFFGQGTLLTLLEFLGIGYVLFVIVTKEKQQKWAQETILMVFLIMYFAIVGNFAVGFMRYLLPLYPILCLFAALFSERILMTLRSYSVFLFSFITIIFTLSLLLFPLTFLHIYTVPNTRVEATTWILKHIPKGKTLAIEHWDDALPLVGQSNYPTLTLPLYDPDTAEKWQFIKQSLAHSDYIIIASMRLMEPLERLTNCRILPNGYCYPLTAAYYKKLTNGKLGFRQVADFTVSPTVPLLNLPIPDQSADESFTVYDHPHVLIFEKIAEIR